jgi:hypothetical protein
MGPRHKKKTILYGYSQRVPLGQRPRTRLEDEWQRKLIGQDVVQAERFLGAAAV